MACGALIGWPAARAAVAVAATGVLVGLCSGCGSKTTPTVGPSMSSSHASPARSTANSSPAPSTTPSIPAVTGAECQVRAPGASSIDGVFDHLAGFTVKSICPADVVPSLGGPEVMTASAAEVSQNGNIVLRVVAAQLKSGGGDAFVARFISEWEANRNNQVPTERQDLGGHQVTWFNIPVNFEGYAYAQGPTVIIAYGGPAGQMGEPQRDAFTKILANLH
jgi:hypothetical protein